jgi:hypothetical protein
MSVSGGEILAVVDSGPIAYSAMALFGDMDLEHGLGTRATTLPRLRIGS